MAYFFAVLLALGGGDIWLGGNPYVITGRSIARDIFVRKINLLRIIENVAVCDCAIDDRSNDICPHLIERCDRVYIVEICCCARLNSHRVIAFKPRPVGIYKISIGLPSSLRGSYGVSSKSNIASRGTTEIGYRKTYAKLFGSYTSDLYILQRQISPQRNLGVIFSDLIASFGDIQCRDRIGAAVSSLATRSLFDKKSYSVSAPSFTQCAIGLPYRIDQAAYPYHAEECADSRPKGGVPRFVHCFFSSDGGAPLGAQVGCIVIGCGIAGFGIPVGIRRVRHSWGRGWRGRRNRRLGLASLLSGLGALLLLGWMISAS